MLNLDPGTFYRGLVHDLHDPLGLFKATRMLIHISHHLFLKTRQDCKLLDLLVKPDLCKVPDITGVNFRTQDDNQVRL